jgi:hypothetical protein
VRTSIESNEAHVIELKFDRHYAAFGHAVNFPAFLAIPGYAADLRVFEDGSVKFCRFFSLVIEPQARGNFLSCCHVEFFIDLKYCVSSGTLMAKLITEY